MRINQINTCFFLILIIKTHNLILQTRYQRLITYKKMYNDIQRKKSYLRGKLHVYVLNSNNMILNDTDLIIFNHVCP